MKNLITVSILFVIIFLFWGCKKNSETTLVTGTIPVVVTGNSSNLLLYTVDFTGNVTSDGGSAITRRGFCASSSNKNPTITDDTVISGNGTGSYSGTVKGLKGQTTYYVRSYATNAAGTGYGNTDTIKTIDSTLTDIDNNHYRLVQIGSQVWMEENLRVLHYLNGDAIPNVTDNTQWSALNTGAYCWYNNDATTYSSTYGALYNWYAVSDTRTLAPAGYHVPSDAEWTDLTNFLGGLSVAGGKLKETGISHWQSPNTGATNETGFTALPGGYRYFTGIFGVITVTGNWWSETEGDATYAWYYDLNYDKSSIDRSGNYTQGGFSVRCIRN